MNYLGFEDFSLLNNGLLTVLRRTTKTKTRSNHPGQMSQVQGQFQMYCLMLTAVDPTQRTTLPRQE